MGNLFCKFEDEAVDDWTTPQFQNQNHHTSFKVIEVNPSLKLWKNLTEITFKEVMDKFKIKKLESWSCSEKLIDVQTQTNTGFYGCTGEHGFVTAARLAFAYHYPLCFSADDVWTLIIQGVSQYILFDPEEFRGYFVNFDGKKTLKVNRDDFVKGKASNDWGSVFVEMSREIGKNIGAKNMDVLCPTFSTTGIVEHSTHSLSLMCAMQNYFDYNVITRCGISKVKLLGVQEDWDNLLSRVQALRRYKQMIPWLDTLVPIVEKFQRAYAGEIDKRFWNSIYKHIEEHSGSTEKVDGWISCFFPYAKETSWMDFGRENANAAGSKRIKEFRTLEAIYKDEMEHNVWGRTGINVSLVPNGIMKTPFQWEYHSQQIEMTAYNGFMGAKLTDDGFVKPVLGWAVGKRTS